MSQTVLGGLSTVHHVAVKQKSFKLKYGTVKTCQLLSIYLFPEGGSKQLILIYNPKVFTRNDYRGVEV